MSVHARLDRQIASSEIACWTAVYQLSGGA